MRLRYVVSLAAAAAVAAVLAASASAGPATAQVQVMMQTNSTCHITLSRVGSSERLILFHIVNNSAVPRGIVVWGVHSTMALPNQSANLYVNFRGPGNYPFACTANTYKNPTITGRGVFHIGFVNGKPVFKVIPAIGGARGGLTA